MNKSISTSTNIELALEAGAQIDRGSELLLCGSAIDRYTALVEARMTKRLMEDAGEPMKCIGADEKDINVYTTDQIVAVILRERSKHKPYCKECKEWRDKLANAVDNYKAINKGREIIRRLAKDAVNSRGKK